MPLPPPVISTVLPVILISWFLSTNSLRRRLLPSTDRISVGGGDPSRAERKGRGARSCLYARPRLPPTPKPPSAACRPGASLKPRAEAVRMTECAPWPEPAPERRRHEARKSGARACLQSPNDGVGG